MKKKTVSILVFTAICAALWCARYISFNEKISAVYYTDLVTFEMNDEVEYGNNLMNLDENDGYRVKLKSARIYGLEDFMSSHNIEEIPESITEIGLPEMICLLTIEVTNFSNELDSIFLGNLSSMYGRDIVLQANEFILDINPELNLAEEYSVRPEIGQSQLVHVPFSLYKSSFSQKDWAALTDYPFFLEVTQFPKKQVIRVACEYV